MRIYTLMLYIPYFLKYKSHFFFIAGQSATYNYYKIMKIYSVILHVCYFHRDKHAMGLYALLFVTYKDI